MLAKDGSMNCFEIPSAADTQAVDAAITTRRSMRAFLPTPVPQELIEQILGLAARAPSGTNTQPWQVHVLTGAAKQRLSDRIEAIYEQPEGLAKHEREYEYYPQEWTSPYLDRRRKVGWDLYGLLGLAKTDKEGMHRQHGRNYRFFDAPVGLIFSIDRVMAQGSWLDYGMFLQTLMIAARARGLHTCPQAAFTQFHRVIAEEVDLRPEQMVVCGMALGYADPSAVENTLVTERAAVSEFTRFLKA
jgi:nitroreductase